MTITSKQQISTRKFLVFGALAASLVLSACSSAPADPTSEPNPNSGTGEPTQSVEEYPFEAQWYNNGKFGVFLTWGSSSCAPVAGETKLVTANEIKIELEKPAEDQMCTSDYAPRYTTFGGVDGLDLTKPVKLVLVGEDGTSELSTQVPALAVAEGETEEYPVEARWFLSGKVAQLLSWGSSSCLPTVEETTAVSATELAVKFAKPAADRACTMDFAPRLTAIQVPEGIDPSQPVKLVVTAENQEQTFNTVIPALVK